MEAREIRLVSSRLQEWLRDREQSITVARDALSLLESQTGRLGAVWESGAGEQWESAFTQHLARAAECIYRMEKLFLKTEETAARLEETERKLRAEAESL